MGWWDDQKFEDMVPNGGITGGMTGTIQPVATPDTSPQAQADPRLAKLEAFRTEARNAGVPIDSTDANVFADPRFDAWRPGQQLPASLLDVVTRTQEQGSAGVPGMPGAIKPYGETFKQPTSDDARNMEGYKFTVQEALRALDSRKSAQGKLRAGQARDTANLVTGLADQQYGQRFNQALQTFDTNLGAYYAGQDRKFNSGMQINRAGRSDVESDRNYGLAKDATGLARDQFGRLLDRDLVGDQFALAEMGSPVRGAAVSGAYTSDLADLYTQGGNAAAAGTVGSANAWSNALGSAVPLAQSYVLSRALRPAA